MTQKIEYRVNRPAQDGDDSPANGTIECRPLRRRYVDHAVVLPAAFRAPLVDGVAVLQLAEPDPQAWCWVITERCDRGIQRNVLFTEVGGTIYADDLVDVDPETFDPVPNVPTVQQAIDAEAQAREDADDALDARLTDVENDKANSADVYTKSATDSLLSAKADADDVYTKSESDGLLADKADATDVYEKSQVYSKGEADAKFATAIGANVSRFIARARSGESLTVTVLGDSIWAGQTVTNPATDGAAILLASDLSDRFDTSVTFTNRAVGGRTMLTMHTFSDVENALADKADLYIIGGGRNDCQIYFGTQGGEYGPGYQQADSIAARERVIRMIRERVPKADIMLTSETPYAAAVGGSTNPIIEAYYTDVQRLAAEYGCEFVDVFHAVEALGDYSSLMHPDGVHPNTAGHRFMADRVLDHLPADYVGPALAPGKPSNLSTRKPGEVDGSMGRLGYVVASSASATGLTLTKSGSGWSGTNPHVTSNAGDYIEYAFTGTELHVNLNLSSSVTFDVAVDGVTVKEGANPRLTGSTVASYVPVAVGLSPTSHTVRITLASGTLSINQAAALVGPGSDLLGNTVTIDLTGTPSIITVNSGGSVGYLLFDVAVPLPPGWAAMDVDFSIVTNPRISGETTTWREFQFVLRRTTVSPWVIINNYRDAMPPVAVGVVARRTLAWTTTDRARLASQLYRLEVYASGTDKTNQYVDTWRVLATCRRIA